MREDVREMGRLGTWTGRGGRPGIAENLPSFKIHGLLHFFPIVEHPQNILIPLSSFVQHSEPVCWWFSGVYWFFRDFVSFLRDYLGILGRCHRNRQPGRGRSDSAGVRFL